MNKAMGCCLTPGCPGSVHVRGLCYRCYSRLCRRVQRGTTTWGQLVKDSKAGKARCYHEYTTAKRRELALEASRARDIYRDVDELMRDKTSRFYRERSG